MYSKNVSARQSFSNLRSFENTWAFFISILCLLSFLLRGLNMCTQVLKHLSVPLNIQAANDPCLSFPLNIQATNNPYLSVTLNIHATNNPYLSGPLNIQAANDPYLSVPLNIQATNNPYLSVLLNIQVTNVPYLSVPLNIQATNNPGTPGTWLMRSITNSGYNCKQKTYIEALA